MKSKFKKLIILTHRSVKSRIIRELRDIGIIHLERKNLEESSHIEEVISRKNTLRGIIKTLEQTKIDNSEKSNEKCNLQDVINSIQSLQKEIESLSQKIEGDEKELHKLSKWGDFNHKNLQPLLEQGLNIFLAFTTKKNFKELDLSEYYFKEINEDDQNVYLAFFSKNDKLDLPIEYFKLTGKSPATLKEKIKNEREELSQLEKSLASYSQFLPELQEAFAEIHDEVEILEADYSFSDHAEGKLLSLSGWYPIDKEEKLSEFLNVKGIAHYIRKPAVDEDVPVHLKNPKYTKLFEPITNIFELPNYFETDLTPFIAVFYPILFAYCLGDAGYGFVLTLMMIVGLFTFFKEQKRVAILGIILGTVTTVMGFVKSGSLFGIMLVSDHQQPWVRFLSQWVFIPDDSEFIFNAFNVALMIGVIQILTGIVVSIYTRAKYEGKLYALNPLGKLCIVLSLLWIFMADMQNSEWFQSDSIYRYGLLFTGLILVMLFHELSEPIVKRIATSVMPLFFIFTGLLGDILSYVRLFALGLASSVLGLVVNQIGQQIMDGGIIALVGGILFLIFGHSLNFGIAALGSFVHPLRLTFVEFYGNASFKGKGKPYKPYQKSFKTHTT